MDPNNTLEDLINAEQEMVLGAELKYGEYFSHAGEMVTLLNNLVPKIDKPTHFLFLVFLSQVKTHLTQALFSAVRRHHVQAGMNLRQVLEASVWAAYAMAFEDLDLFRVEGSNGLEVPERLKNACRDWLKKNYPKKSEEILRLKKQINSTIAHAKIDYAFQTFSSDLRGRQRFTTSYFDIEDDFRIKMDLLMIANFAMGMLQLFTTINMEEKVFRFQNDFPNQFRKLGEQHERLRLEIQGHERFPKSDSNLE